MGRDKKVGCLRSLRELPVRTTLMAIFLFVTGTVLLWVGLVEWNNDTRDRALPMIILGSICFLPGSYASYILFGAWRRWPGFEYDQVPSYDEE